MIGPVLALVLVLQDRPPAAHWKLDGDFADAAGGAPAQGQGRPEFIDSPIGSGGKCLYFNGLDTFAQADAPSPAEFTVTLWVHPFDARATRLVARAWVLELLPDGALRLGETRTAAGLVPPGQWTHVALGARAIFVNGTAAANAKPEGAAAPLAIGKGADPKSHFHGLIDDVRLHDRDLGAEELGRLVDAGLPWVRGRAHLQEPFAGKFEVREGDVVVFVGGANMVEAQEQGYLETLLARRGVRFRCMAWEGDTVYEQKRMLNFGSWRRQFDRVRATVVIAQYGQFESLEGKDGLDRFVAAYEKLLDEFALKRLVLLSPTPFEKRAPPLPDLSARNGGLEAYVDAIGGLAKRREAIFVDLFRKLGSPVGLTRDGVHLTADGQLRAARAAAPGAVDESLREVIREKNRLWTDYWRPANHAFLHGDRTQVEYSRDYRDNKIRRFLVEMEQFPPLIRRAEDRIDEILKGK